MYYIIQNKKVKTLNDAEAEEIKEFKKTGTVKQKIKNPTTGKDEVIDSLGVITEKKRYIETLGLWTKETPPEINDDQRLELVQDGKKVKWVKVDLTNDEKVQKKFEKINSLYNDIEELKRELLKSDYAIIKIAEGVATKEEYKGKIAERGQFRIKIGEIEKQISDLEMEIESLRKEKN